MKDKRPIRWKIILLVNLGMLGGCILAAFTIPPTTRLSVFAFSCLAVLIAFNIYFYFVRYRRAESEPPADSAEAKQKRRKAIVWCAICLALILWDIANRYWRK